MKLKRILCAFLTLVMVFGTLAGASVFSVSAAPTVATDKEEEDEFPDYLTLNFRNVEAKLATMTKYLENELYELYVEPLSGEVALKNKVTGQTVTSNPFDIATLQASTEIKNKLMSQLIVEYVENGVNKTYNSFAESTNRQQILVKRMKNGVRVEYTIGREEARMLLPQQIEKTRFEELIASYFPENSRAYKQLTAYYQLKDLEDPTLTVRSRQELQVAFPIVKQMPVYVFDSTASRIQKQRIEGYIKLYCPHYTYETLEIDHDMTGYVSKDIPPAVFYMALEYSIDNEGLNVRLPTNGIRFDEGTYQLKSITVLPYFGAGSSSYTGYLMIPDGSGSIIRFEDVIGQAVNISGKLYGQDYTFHSVSGAHQQSMRMPVYGLVEDYTGIRSQRVEKVTPAVLDEEGNVVTPEKTEMVTELVPYKESRGFLAIVEEGDTLANLYAECGGTMHKLNTVYTSFNPRPSDSYNLADSISVGSNASWTVVSKRTYTGNYKIKYIMLTDEITAETKGLTNDQYFKASYAGMADAYRSYLINKGVLTEKLTPSETLPLYFESFGTVQTLEKFFSVPIEVETPLTTFEDLKTIANDLSASGIKSVNMILKGYTNGGVVSGVPTSVKFQKKVGGDDGYADFLAYANANGIGVYPSFDFMYVDATTDKLFDGFTFRKDAARTIDDRFTQKKTYDYVYQTFVTNGLVLVSPSALDVIYKDFIDEYTKLGYNGVSFSTLGSDLNSDFDEENPYNREDSRKEIVDFLAKADEDMGNIMLDAGNSYTWQYANHLTNVALDSSRYMQASEAIPFMGMVLHGYINIAGSPINMSGDINYEILKIIENGASPYFLLSYQNTAALKEDVLLSRYYSVAYDIWKDDLVKYYNIVNDALVGVQDKLITDHEFIYAERVASEAELERDALEEAEAAKEAALLEAIEAEKEARAEALAERKAREEAEAKGEEYVPKVKIEKEEAEEEEEEDDGSYKMTKYTVKRGTVVKVTYEDGTTFILNYNHFEIEVEGQRIGSLGFLKLN
ncbi:MAG: hypothetical protein E7655_05220 [Ruminococcaceae bacterium]|nr:hypothetical protein [Oscillospiraceae bacterium]